jgi:hypothetical protein
MRFQTKSQARQLAGPRPRLLGMRVRPAKPPWLLKACASCGGDMYAEGEGYRCIQCGRERPISS